MPSGYVIGKIFRPFASDATDRDTADVSPDVVKGCLIIARDARVSFRRIAFEWSGSRGKLLCDEDLVEREEHICNVNFQAAQR